MLFANYNVMLGCCFVVVNRLLILLCFPTTAELREISEMQRLKDIPHDSSG